MPTAVTKRFRRDFGTNGVSEQEYGAAAEAVKMEYRANSQTVRLRCLRVEPSQTGDSSIFALQVARFGDMDWTWEGARAYRNVDVNLQYAWSGEVLEVDQVHSTVFVRVGDGNTAPIVGDFFVEPFGFLESLHKLYNGEFAAAVSIPLRLGLAAAVRTLTPRVLQANEALPHLRGVWGGSLGFLWGPPGTGKTWTIGQQVASALVNGAERVLVVSTTNKATDQAAISIGEALRQRGVMPTRSLVARIGSGANIESFRSKDLEELLVGGEAWLRERLALLLREYAGCVDPHRRAELMAQIQAIRLSLATCRESVWDVDSRVVVSTSFAAVKDLATPDAVREIQMDRAAFSTVLMDEAGLISRAATAALTLHAAQRFVLVGDPRQLSPISKISRVVPSTYKNWLADSGLQGLTVQTPGTHRLIEQHRMHPEIRHAVSHYQYDGSLCDHTSVTTRQTPIPTELHRLSRAAWYVLDEDMGELAHIRAERGPGNKSWIRQRTKSVLDRVFRASPNLRATQGLFITPFVAQARSIGEWLHSQGLEHWQASTTHRQQGAEADVVIFDTVNASSTAWPHDEWKRLVNVSISRARHLLIVLSSRAEMGEPYLAPLKEHLTPYVLKASGGQIKWTRVEPAAAPHRPNPDAAADSADGLGAQLERRKALRPILSAEQQRLCAYPLDGKPRLVRGVAGSGKTAVLANWLVRRLAEDAEPGVSCVVYANAALRGLLQQTIQSAWIDLGRREGFPWGRVQLFHVLELLEKMESLAAIRSPVGEGAYDYAARATRLLREPIKPLWRALFVDEAQDFGEATLAYLTRLVEPASAASPNERSVNIFYDNAQNLYRRGTPTWSSLGLDMRGRSTVMKESFRSTQPITEFALNVLYRLRPPDKDPDHLELLERDLLDHENRNGRLWWRVRFNHVGGPHPDFKRYTDRGQEMAALARRISDWIQHDRVRPGDIRVIANDRSIRAQAVRVLEPVLHPLSVNVEERTRQSFDNDDATVIVTTPHSIKGYESEVVAVTGADHFAAKIDGNARKALLAESLYVAMTRARSVLYVSAINRAEGSAGGEIVKALQASLEDLWSPPEVTAACTPLEEQLEIIERVGQEHRNWVRELHSRFEVLTAPIVGRGGEVLAEPLFWFKTTSRSHAYFESTPSSFVRNQLADMQIEILEPGASVP